MNERSISPPQSQSLVDPEMPPKRQKVDASNPSTSSTSGSDFVLGNDWEMRRMKRELAALRLKLSQTEAIAVQHHKLRKQTEELLVKEKSILEMEVERDKETIKQLEEDLDTAMKRVHESCKSQMAAEEQIKELSTKNAKLRSNSTQLTSEGFLALQKSQAEFDLKSMKLEQAKIIIQKLNSASRDWVEREKLMTSRIKELEEEVESAKEKIAVLNGVVERVEQKKLIVMEEKSKNVEKLRGRCQEFSFKVHERQEEEGVISETLKQGIPGSQHVEVIDVEQSEAQGDDQQSQQNKDDKGQRKMREAKKKSVEMTRRNIEEFDDVQSVVNGLTADDRDPTWNVESDEVSSKSQSGDDDSDSQVDENEDVEERSIGEKRVDGDLRVYVGKHYHVLASSSAFFRIVWQYEYHHKAPRKWACKKCNVVQNTRNKIEDHVWVNHYDGNYKCPFCINQSRLLLRRDSIREHVKQAHPQFHHVLGAKAVK